MASVIQDIPVIVCEGSRSPSPGALTEASTELSSLGDLLDIPARPRSRSLNRVARSDASDTEDPSSAHTTGGASFFEGRFGRGWGSCNDLAVGDSAPESSSEVEEPTATRSPPKPRSVSEYGLKLRMRGPKELYRSLKSETFEAKPPRWPVELDLLTPGPKHLHTSFPKVERYVSKYQTTTPSVSTKIGEQVYSCAKPMDMAKKVSFTRFAQFTSEQADMPAPVYELTGPDDDTLLFESRFESGNLLSACRIGPNEYNLTLRRDLRTSRHTQWFYFRVKNMREGREYQFNITNLMKRDSLYNHGMQPVVYSEHDAADGVGWHRGGYDVCYFKNSSISTIGKRRGYLYTLSFKYRSPRSDDTMYFAHCYPYTYSDLQSYLAQKLTDPVMKGRMKRRLLCQTLAGNNCDLLTITSFGDPNPRAMEARKAIVITARVHPGESNSSWMMKGFLDFLLSDDPDAKTLRETFVFKVIPMLNPDGVIVGNYRCNLAGNDLNRNHRNPSRNLHPTIYHLKSMIKNLSRDRPVVLVCDLHGHSRQHGVFMYGCDNRDDPRFRLKVLLTKLGQIIEIANKERVFPTMMFKNAPERFTFKGCKFRVQASKSGTGRVVAWKEHRVMNSFTMEATFCGSKITKKQFSIADFESIGFTLCDSLLDYFDPSPDKAAVILENIKEDLRNKLRAKLGLPAKTFIDLDDYELESDLESSTAGSDSSPSESELPTPPIHKKQLRPLTQKHRKRVRAVVAAEKEQLDKSPAMPRREPRQTRVSAAAPEEARRVSRPTPRKPESARTPGTSLRASSSTQRVREPRAKEPERQASVPNVVLFDFPCP